MPAHAPLPGRRNQVEFATREKRASGLSKNGNHHFAQSNDDPNNWASGSFSMAYRCNVPICGRVNRPDVSLFRLQRKHEEAIRAVAG
jgi:hypothetical protein